MKILFFMNGLHKGGKERRMLELMKELKLREGIHFELVLMNTEISYPEIFDMDVKLHFLIRKTRKDIFIFKRFYEICKEYIPDIVHCWDGMTATYAIPACKLLKIRLLNGMVVDAPLKRNVSNKKWVRAKLTFPFSDIIVGNSKAGLAAYNAPVSKSICIHNGYNFSRNDHLLDPQKIREQLNIRSEYIIGMVASFSGYKDYKTFYNSAKLILTKRQDITFLAIGNNTDSAASQQLIDHEFKEHFRLIGNIQDVESYINMMDIGVLATFSEGISNSIMEFMALGKPVIATMGGGTVEIIENNKTGFLVNISDAEDLANKMKILLNDPGLRNQMGLKGKERIQDLFSIENMVSQFISLYAKMINKSKFYQTSSYEYAEKKIVKHN